MLTENTIRVTIFRQTAVIVPVYNTGKHKLTKCIRAILAQSYQHFVLILVDDGSTDDSGQVCDYFAYRDSRVKVIHQVNKGSVEARKTGVFSDEAQAAKYICFCDSDDTMRKDALEKLVTTAEQEQADCVCANMCRVYRGIRLPQRFTPPCFSDGKVKAYTTKEIISDLYISCFGISNYPVNLVAKLYRTKLVTQASDHPPVVRFMGDDLSVTLRMLPETQKLVIIPDVIYNYRIGGDTSKFMPYMLDDFLQLYRFKKALAARYPMPQNVQYLMAVEMKNIVLSWLEMCALSGKYDNDALREEIKRVCGIPEIEEAVRQRDFVEKEPTGIRKAIEETDVEFIDNALLERIAAGKYRRLIKKLLK